MTNFIPIFPLDIVVYPGEYLNLHVFEPRYKQLIQECVAGKKAFGIPTVLDKKIKEHGCLMEVVEIVKTYENDEMDVRTKGREIFRILEVIKQIPDKLYCGAIVNYPENVTGYGNNTLANKIISEVKRLYSLMNVEGKFPEHTADAISYEIAHYVGLTREQEYELQGIFTELQRLEYLRRHLNSIQPVIHELEEIKARIQRNGHFRNLSMNDLDL